jgi:hypothetical protein
VAAGFRQLTVLQSQLSETPSVSQAMRHVQKTISNADFDPEGLTTY